MGCLLLVVLSAYWLLSTLAGAREDFVGSDLPVVFGGTAAVLAVQILVIALIHRFVRNAVVTALVCGLLLCINAFSLNFVLTPQFAVLHTGWIVLLFAVGVFIAFSLVQLMAEVRWLGGAAIVVALGLTAIPAAQLALGRNDGAAELGVDIIRMVDFVEKPNVYFVGVESLQPEPVLQKYLGLETLEPQHLLQDEGFHLFRNLFSEGTSTKIALHCILGLERVFAVYMEFEGLRGMRPSPLLEIFKHNGYETTTFYHSTYFGAPKGPYVDRYVTLEPYSLCSFMLPVERALAFFGLCNFSSLASEAPDANDEQATLDLLVDTIESLAAQDRPQMLFAHFGATDHTPTDYQGTPEQKAEFLGYYREAAHRAAGELKRVIDTIKTADPGALIFIFGDHGVWLSRGQDLEQDPVFWVQDRLAVLGGVYPADRCASTFNSPAIAQFATTPQVARLIIQCLAGGEDPFTAPYNYDVNYDGVPYAGSFYE